MFHLIFLIPVLVVLLLGILLLAALHPIFIDAVPLSLEEIFIYELGGEDYAIRDIVL